LFIGRRKNRENIVVEGVLAGRDLEGGGKSLYARTELDGMKSGVDRRDEGPCTYGRKKNHLT